MNIYIPKLNCVTVPANHPHPLDLVRPENWVRGDHYTKKGFGRYEIYFYHDSYYEKDGRRVVLRVVNKTADWGEGLKLIGKSSTVHELLPDGSEDVWPV